MKEPASDIAGIPIGTPSGHARASRAMSHASYLSLKAMAVKRELETVVLQNGGVRIVIQYGGKANETFVIHGESFEGWRRM